MIGTNISFTKEKNGYDRKQVDSYIKKISEAYEKNYYEFLDVSGKYKSLLEEHKSSDNRESAGMNPDIAAKTLINTEMLAQKIIADAQAEANAILEKAGKIVDDAKIEAEKVKEEALKIIDDANAEVAEIKEDAQRALDDSVSEATMMAAQTRKDIEQARKIIDSASSEVEKLLTFRVKEKEIALAA